ncbi:hypothetical protein M426DRAFT_323828 [Hypoxylon sp. CI-4A]|nr:hypothetical protein M426DRAFT_323828 [Hypoxylon sp. CI-4A]
MACVDVGSTNPDIAGLGILLAFAIQAGLSFLLSLWSIGLDIRLYWLNSVRYQTPARDILDILSNGSGQEGLLAPLRRKYIKHYSDIGPAQCGILKDKMEHKSRLVSQVLEKISGAQILNGISLLIGTFAQHDTLDLYHYHIIYDTVSLTGVSAAAGLMTTFSKRDDTYIRESLIIVFIILHLAFVVLFDRKLQSWDDDVPGSCFNTSNISTPEATHPYVDRIYLSLTSLYFYAIFLSCIPTVTSKSRAATSISASPRTGQRKRRRPDLDHFMGLMLGITEGTSGRSTLNAQTIGQLTFSMSVLLVAILQFPLHTYMLFTLRNSNEGYLSGDSENVWGFGQVVALALVASVLLECVQAFVEYKRSD